MHKQYLLDILDLTPVTSDIKEVKVLCKVAGKQIKRSHVQRIGIAVTLGSLYR